MKWNVAWKERKENLWMNEWMAIKWCFGFGGVGEVILGVSLRRVLLLMEICFIFIFIFLPFYQVLYTTKRYCTWELGLSGVKLSITSQLVYPTLNIGSQTSFYLFFANRVSIFFWFCYTLNTIKIISCLGNSSVQK